MKYKVEKKLCDQLIGAEKTPVLKGLLLFHIKNMKCKNYFRNDEQENYLKNINRKKF